MRSSNSARHAASQVSGGSPSTNKYDGTARRGSGRSGTAASLQRLLVQFATEDPHWGYTRLRGALGNLGYELGRNTIKRILADHGLAPAPKRG